MPFEAAYPDQNLHTLISAYAQIDDIESSAGLERMREVCGLLAKTGTCNHDTC